MRLFPNRKYQPVGGDPNWGLWRWHDIIPTGETEVYLRRLYLVQTPWFGVKLHWIHRPDTDRHLHDHPWWFVSFVLWGGYEEIVPYAGDYKGKDIEYRDISWFNFKRATDSHRIVCLHESPTLTLVINGPKTRTWGFHTENGFVPWRQYLNVK